MRVAVMLGPPPWPARVRIYLKRLEAEFPPEALLIIDEPPPRSVRSLIRRHGLWKATPKILAAAAYRPHHRAIRAAQQAAFGPLVGDWQPATPQVALGPVNGEKTQAWLREHKPDAVIPIAGVIIKPPLLALCRWIRWHHGITPLIRGLAAPFWAVYEQRPDWLGGTVQELVAELDAGPILMQDTVKPLKTDTYASAHVKIDQLMVDLLLASLKGLRDGTLTPRKPDLSVGVYKSAPTLGQVLRFSGRARRFFREFGA